MESARADLKVVMHEYLQKAIHTAADSPFASRTCSLNKIDAEQTQHARQLLEVKHEVSARSSKMAAGESSSEKLTAALP